LFKYSIVQQQTKEIDQSINPPMRAAGGGGGGGVEVKMIQFTT